MQPPAQQVSPPIAEKLRQTQPWLRFIAIMMLIGSALMALGGLASVGIGGMIMADLVPSASSGTSMHAASGAILAALGAGYLLGAAIYVFPALHLLRSARAIRDLAADGSEDSALRALEGQRRFWKFAGIALIVILVIYLVAILAAILIPAFAAVQAAAREAQ